MEYLTYDEAAHWFTQKGIRLSPLTLRRWVSRKRVPHRKVYGRVFFDPRELETFLDKTAVPAKAVTA